MRRILMYATFVTLFAAVDMNSSQAQSPVTKKDASNALNSVRLINTAEVYFQRTAKRYGAFADLVSTGTLKKAAQMNENFQSAYDDLNLRGQSKVLNGFAFSIVVTPDGAAYKLSLVEKKDCGAAYFSDERGIIYQ